MSTDQKQDELLAHNYDGIQEYDNQLPRWWVWQFWITIIAMVIYLFYYHVGPGVLPLQQLALDTQQAERDAAARAPAEMNEEELKTLTASAEMLELGKSIFAARCVACHGNAGQGIVGPNLTDDNWIRGGKLVDIRNTISNGVVEKGMLAWKGLLTETELNAVTGYIRSLRGTNPPGAKPAEGELVNIS